MVALGPHVAPYLSASLFLRFRCDGEGAIPLPLYAQYLTQHSNVLRLVGGSGFASSVYGQLCVMCSMAAWPLGEAYKLRTTQQARHIRTLTPFTVNYATPPWPLPGSLVALCP